MHKYFFKAEVQFIIERQFSGSYIYLN